MKIAIMQPYFFPYIGYFQLVNSVDKFVFYDDVNFITRGWINRNRILVNNREKLITLSLLNSSQNKRINEIKTSDRNSKILKTIEQSYSKAPFFNEIFPIIFGLFQNINNNSLISEISSASVIKISEYLELNTIFEFSSIEYKDTLSAGRSERLIEICHRNGANIYINLSGGEKLYTPKEFLKKGVELKFIENGISKYNQFSKNFISHLSIIDVVMFNAPNDVLSMLNNYKLK